MELQGQTALVTGGTAGIGLESARLLAREGADVIITGRDVERGKKAVEDIHEAGSVRFVAADLADLDSVAELVREAGPVDIIVNGAGAFPVAPTVEQEVSSFERIFDTNVRGAYFLVARLVPHMLEQGRGSIINITSIAASKGIPGASVYSASKAALTSLTRTWAAEFGSGGVRVNAVSPAPPAPTGCCWSGARASRTSPRRFPSAVRHEPTRSRRRSCSWPRPYQLHDGFDDSRRRREHRDLRSARTCFPPGKEKCMSTSEVVVIASMSPAEGRWDHVQAALSKAIEQTHAQEPRVLRYAMYAGPDRLVMIEKYADEAALEAHTKSPALLGLLDALDGALSAPMDVQVLTSLPAGDPAKGRSEQCERLDSS